MAGTDFQFWRIPYKSATHTRTLVRRCAQVYGAHPLMQVFVVRRVLRPAGVEPRDLVGAARAIHAWVTRHIEFHNESGEQVKTPGCVLRVRFGDCDDRTGLVAAMLESIRIPWRLQLLARRVDGRLRPFHIWPQARISGRWWDLETSDRAARFGEHPVALMKRLQGLSL